MKTIPAPLIIQRNQEEVRSLYAFQQRLALRFSCDCLTKVCTQAREYRRLEQKAPQRGFQGSQNLLLHVVEEKTMATSKDLHKSSAILPLAQRESRQLQTRNPAFRPVLQGCYIFL